MLHFATPSHPGLTHSLLPPLIWTELKKQTLPSSSCCFSLPAWLGIRQKQGPSSPFLQHHDTQDAQSCGESRLSWDLQMTGGKV